MKPILTILAVLTLSGCATMPAASDRLPIVDASLAGNAYITAGLTGNSARLLNWFGVAAVWTAGQVASVFSGNGTETTNATTNASLCLTTTSLATNTTTTTAAP